MKRLFQLLRTAAAWLKRLFVKPKPKAYLIDLDYIKFFYHRGRKP